ncbi:MAG TPA: hypothetical protein PKH02_05890 [Bacteroidales bacterium]|nr:hypothetical protein [Bacteroidales bacterium]HPT12502.1 hypothetical protein [Bacteroidales bacterium]
MAADLDNYLNEAIELELNVSDLYLLFYNLFPMDSNFWWNLTIEEKNHAALLKNLKDLYHVCHEFPEEIFSANIEELKNANKDIRENIDLFKSHPSRRKAFEYAVHIEESAGEAHFQAFTESNELPDPFEVFRQLNMDDRNHAKRIQNYMLQNAI